MKQAFVLIVVFAVAHAAALSGPPSAAPEPGYAIRLMDCEADDHFEAWIAFKPPVHNKSRVTLNICSLYPDRIRRLHSYVIGRRHLNSDGGVYVTDHHTICNPYKKPTCEEMLSRTSGNEITVTHDGVSIVHRCIKVSEVVPMISSNPSDLRLWYAELHIRTSGTETEAVHSLCEPRQKALEQTEDHGSHPELFERLLRETTEAQKS